jgi:hypothetical protein
MKRSGQGINFCLKMQNHRPLGLEMATSYQFDPPARSNILVNTKTHRRLLIQTAIALCHLEPPG